MSYDDEREVRLEEDLTVLADHPAEDEPRRASHLGLGTLGDPRWGPRWEGNDRRLMEDRPPHWD